MTVGHNKGPMGHTNTTHVGKNDGYPMETINVLNEKLHECHQQTDSIRLKHFCEDHIYYNQMFGLGIPTMC